MFREKQVAIVNVGANEKHYAGYGKLKSPILADRKFEFVPIPAGKLANPQYETWIDRIDKWPRYENLRSFYNDGESLEKYLPLITRGKWLRQRIHDDPQLNPNSGRLNYGDYFGPRSSKLWKLRNKDFILFLVHLSEWKNDCFEGKGGFYLGGLIEVDKYVDLEDPNTKDLESCWENPHVLAWRNRRIDRKAAEEMDFKNHRVFSGTARSQRFVKAVPFKWNIATKVLRDSKGEKFKRNSGTELSRIGSYTRAVRLIEGENAEDRKELLWQHIKQYSIS